jgi:DNA-binding response OmpR family regulator
MANRATILCVDDEPALLETISVILGAKGFKVVTASSGAQARSLFENSEIALVLMDCCLPDEEGLAVAADMKRLRPMVPIILCTGDPDFWHVSSKCADEVLSKPIDPSELLRTVSDFVARHETESEPRGAMANN